MTYKYFSAKGVISRVFLDENADPSYCETFDSRIGEFKINNSILEDLFNHSDSVEISCEEFEKRLERFKASSSHA
jgi:hypothetical protein